DFGAGGYIGQRARPIHERLTAYEIPKKTRERAKLLLCRQEGARVADGRRYLQTIADDAFVAEEFRHAAGIVGSDLASVESVERAAIVLALSQNRDPRKPRLRPFQDEHLEEVPIVVRRTPPLLVVVLGVKR